MDAFISQADQGHRMERAPPRPQLLALRERAEGGGDVDRRVTGRRAGATALQQAYVLVSRQAASRRQRFLFSGSRVALVVEASE